ncbi:MAG: hypothetical protein HDS98_04835 [Bacteroidales bacterium]|nr:hypothetical protein [Bacteroidales bacterium]MBD5338454.1 hypothetical protein [Bacteroides sp.]MDE6805874.1 hypothetical protein [Muribaculaceae bacterium]
MIQLPLNLDGLDPKGRDYAILREAEHNRATTDTLLQEERYMDALERTVNILRELRDFSDFNHKEFRSIFAAVLFDLAEIHFLLKDYKQSEKELDTLFKVLGRLAKEDPDRYGEFHILAMELAARIIRSRKKTIEMLVKQQLQTEALYEKVNAGVASATERLAESLRKVGELMAASGSYKEALKFYNEAIRFSKKRSGRVGRKEIKMTIEMAEVMSRVKTMRQRAKRLLAAVLPHAIALETIELEEDIIALIEMIDKFEDQPSKWKAFMQGLSAIGRSAERDDERERRRAEKEAEKENRKAEKKAEKEARKAEKEAKKAEKEAKKEAHRKEKEARKEAKKAKKAEQEAKENELKAEQAKQSADEARATIAETEKREEK